LLFCALETHRIAVESKSNRSCNHRLVDSVHHCRTAPAPFRLRAQTAVQRNSTFIGKPPHNVKPHRSINAAAGRAVRSRQVRRPSSFVVAPGCQVSPLCGRQVETGTRRRPALPPSAAAVAGQGCRRRPSTSRPALRSTSCSRPSPPIPQVSRPIRCYRDLRPGQLSLPFLRGR